MQTSLAWSPSLQSGLGVRISLFNPHFTNRQRLSKIRIVCDEEAGISHLPLGWTGTRVDSAVLGDRTKQLFAW